MSESKRAICEMCHARCRVLVHSEKGRLVDLEEDRSFPLVDQIFPPTKACLRLRGVKEWFYDPKRVNFPLKRAGEKGEGKWKVISWEQALDEIAGKLKDIKDKYGAEAVGSTGGTGRKREQWTDRFCNLFGTPNHVGVDNICFSPCVAVASAMLGWPVRHRIGIRLEAVASGVATRSVLLVGIDPSQSVLRLWKSLRDGKRLGVKFIVVDPRKTQTAELADLWLQLRPGSDTALLMSMVNVIIEENLYDKEFVTKWCHGFDKVVERAREYPPEKMAEITWVPAEKIREAARMFATNKPGLTVHGMGTEHLTNQTQAIQARYIISAIVGNIDVEGGEYIPGPPLCVSEVELGANDALSPEQKKKQLGTDRFKLLGWPGRDAMRPHVERVWGKYWTGMRSTAMAHSPTLYRAAITGKPYPVKAVLTNSSNPMITLGNTKLVYKALKSLDLYVVMDFWMTPSAELADYVLPAASWLERPFFWTLLGTDKVMVAGEKALPAAIPGEYDHRSDYDYYRGLGLRLGQDWPWETEEATFDYQLKPLGMTHKEFMAKGGYEAPPNVYKKYEKTGFGTPTGKVELYSTIFEKLGYDPLPRYQESCENPVSQPDLAKEYPLMLITGGRFLPMFHSEHRNVDSVRRRHPHPLVQVNPQTATELGIDNGDWVWIETLRGKVRMKCQYFEGIDPRVVHAEHGWWFPELPGEEPWLHGVWESNVNVLTDDDPDVCNELSGGWPLKTALCKIYKVKTY